MNAGIRKERIAMDKKYIEGQPSAETPSKFETKPSLLHTVAEKILTAFGLMLLLSIPLFIKLARLSAQTDRSNFSCAYHSLFRLCSFVCFFRFRISPEALQRKKDMQEFRKSLLQPVL